jgi:hypothetical protein
MRLKLKSDEPLSGFGFKYSLRRYVVVLAELVFSALSEGGPTDRTSAASLRRLFEQVFTLVRPAMTMCVKPLTHFSNFECPVVQMDSSDWSNGTT